jgi:hypothetical protein
MNLVAMEGPLVNRHGALVLSRNAGAYGRLGKHALTVNPFDIRETADAIRDALEMPEEERRTPRARPLEDGAGAHAAAVARLATRGARLGPASARLSASERRQESTISETPSTTMSAAAHRVIGRFGTADGDLHRMFEPSVSREQRSSALERQQCPRCRRRRTARRGGHRCR